MGYFVANLRTLAHVKVGDTIAPAKEKNVVPVPGFKDPKPLVFCGIYPASRQDFDDLRKAIEKLHLNDASFTFHPESSEALGFGFRCGFLGLLHMEIVQQRLERDSNVDIIQTAPNVTYEVVTADVVTKLIERPGELPDPAHIQEFREPIVRVSIIAPPEAIGALMALVTDRRGTFVKQDYLGPSRTILVCDLPLSEMVFDFHDLMKSATRGYWDDGLRDVGVLRGRPREVRILVAGEDVDVGR